MFNRVTRCIVEIKRPFQITGLPRLYPAGSYEVTTEEEPLGDSMTSVFRRVSTTIYLPRMPGDAGLGEFAEISIQKLLKLTGSPSHTTP